MKTRSGDVSQDLEAAMPVRDSAVKEEILEDGETGPSQRRGEKDNSYPQSGPGWGRELRNRFVFNSKERGRSSADYTLRSRYTEQVSVGSRRRHMRSCRMSVSLDERGRVYEEDEMLEDSDDIGMFDNGDDDDDIFTPVKRRERVRRAQSRRRNLSLSQKSRSVRESSRGHHVNHSSTSKPISAIEVEEEMVNQTMNGHDSSSEKRVPDDNQEGEGVRRSTRQRKLIYDNFNTSWILGTQTLRGYPMFLSDKVPVRSCVDKGLRQEVVEPEEPGEEQDDEKEVHKKRRTISDLQTNVIDDSYEDMYSRVKRPRRPVQGIIYSQQKSKSSKLIDGSEEEPTETQSSRSSTDDESGAEGPTGKYHLRKTKPTVERFQATIDPPRRSSRILRSVLCNSVRRRRHRGPTRDASSSSSSDDERFDRKKGKSHTKARNRCLPLNFNAGSSIPGSSNHGRSAGDHKQIVSTLADVDPMSLDRSIRFSHVGGLESHIRCLKEMIVFPMMYREVFEKFHIQPPKGVLFHGPPGTGKTLIARALANECSQGDRQVSFFMRKGADCLSKWVGESERQLRLLFEQAYQKRPSIIFFDEIDGLAPVRSSKQDQIHASIVSTLLALMDGLDNRGEIIVIGATNRIDAIDPALRRPGRFDRELYFPLPAKKERQEILRIHVSQWEKPPSTPLLNQLAEQAVGYCGSDLRALCSEAVIQGLRRRYPQIYKSSQKLLLDPNDVKVEKIDFVRAKCQIVPASHRVTPGAGRKLSVFIEPLLKKPLDSAISSLKESFPQGMSRTLASNSKAVVGFTRSVHRPRLLLVGSSGKQAQTSHLGPALLHHMEHVTVHTLDLTSMYEVSGRSPEEACIQIFQEARRNLPSIIYVPSISEWWKLVPETLHAVFLSHLCKLDPYAPVLLLATSDIPYNVLPHEIQSLFSEYRGEVLVVQDPSMSDREAFFKPLFLTEAARPPKMPRKTADRFEELPLAPPPAPVKLSEAELKKVYENEEATLRELRIFLREICAKLARNRQFFMFTKPVDVQEVPDYLSIIKQPMDLETMMTKIDLHRYVCAQDFLDDVDLLCRNALEYNPDRDPADKLIRHRACSLRDTAYTLIKAEMDSDFEEQCKEISRSRRARAESPSRFAPDFVHTKPLNSQIVQVEGQSVQSTEVPKDTDTATTVVALPNEPETKVVSPTSVATNNTGGPGMRKRVWKFGGSNSENTRTKKRRTSWARGFIKAKNKKIVRRIVSSSFPPHTVNHAASASSANASAESSCASLTQESNSQTQKEDVGPWRIQDAFQEASKDLMDVDSNVSKGCAIVVNGEHPSRTTPPALFSDVGQAKTESSNEDNLDVNPTMNQCSTPMSSHCQSISESFLEDTLIENDGVDDLMSFCDGASQDDASEINGKPFSNVHSCLDAEKQTEPSRKVEINLDEMKRLLSKVVKITKRCQVETLIELYIQLNKCIGRHSKSWTRTSLPQDLEKELKRFEEHNNSNSTAN